MAATAETRTSEPRSRPRGRAPAHHTWDLERGVWVHVETGTTRQPPLARRTNKKKVTANENGEQGVSAAGDVADVTLLDVQWVPERRFATVLLLHQRRALRVTVDGEVGGSVHALDADPSATWRTLHHREPSVLRGQLIVEELATDITELHAIGATLLALPPFHLDALLRPVLRVREVAAATAGVAM